MRLGSRVATIRTVKPPLVVCVRPSLLFIYAQPTSGARVARWRRKRWMMRDCGEGECEFVWDDDEEEGAVGFRAQAIMKGRWYLRAYS